MDTMRIAFVDRYDWEERENLFLIEYKKLHGFPPPENETTIELILETLPIHIRMETII